MKDEIKEILDKLQKVANRKTASRNALMEMKDKDYQLLLDYITNLQEENKKLKEIVENLTTMTVCGDKKQIKNTAQYKLDIYKSRNEKAIEEIKTREDYEIRFKKILNILQGE